MRLSYIHQLSLASRGVPSRSGHDGLRPRLTAVQGERDQELKDKNRIVWNRYFVANLDEETRSKLIEERRHLVRVCWLEPRLA
jgi:hypothetical protein